TILVRGGTERSAYDETSEALFMTSGFVYATAAEAEAAFKQDGSRYVYSRYRNPTVSMFEERLRLIEGAEACRATASGMAAVFAALLCKLRAGQRVVASRALFGSCHYIVAELLPRWGIETVQVDGRDLAAWETALAPGAALELRVERQCRTAEALARFLETHPKVTRVVYPGLPTHPQYELAQKQMSAGGTVVAFDIAGDKEACFRFLDALRLVDISNNLG